MELDELRSALEARPTDELVSILRNRNEDEWRPEVFELAASILAARGVSPAEVAALGPEGREAVEHQPLVTVARYFVPAEAQAGRTALEAAGLPAYVQDESLGTVYGVGIGARLQVRAEDEQAARAVLEGTQVGADELPAEIAEPPCPQCRSRKVRPVSELPKEEEDAGWGRGGRWMREWYYECASCGHRWPQEDE